MLCACHGCLLSLSPQIKGFSFFKAVGTSSYTGSISPHPLLPGRAHRRHGTDPQSDAMSFFLGLPDMLPVRFTVALCLCKLHMEGRREGGMWCVAGLRLQQCSVSVLKP